MEYIICMSVLPYVGSIEPPTPYQLKSITITDHDNCNSAWLPCLTFDWYWHLCKARRQNQPKPKTKIKSNKIK